MQYDKIYIHYSPTDPQDVQTIKKTAKENIDANFSLRFSIRIIKIKLQFFFSFFNVVKKNLTLIEE